jgi:lipopolysaccharide export system permease protein
MIQDGRDPERALTIFAKNGLIASDTTSGALRILLHNGSIHTQSTNGGYSLVSFAEYLLTAEAGRGGVVTHTETEMGVKDLFYAANAPQTEPWMRMKMLAEMHSRFAFPFAVIVFALLAVPLGLQNRRAGKTSGFTISILILLIYYVLLSFLRTFAEKGVIPPFAALWLPNLLFGAFGLALLRMAVAEKSLRDIPALLGFGKRKAA